MFSLHGAQCVGKTNGKVLMRQRTRKRGGEGGGRMGRERGRGGGVPGKQKSSEMTMKVCIIRILELSYDYCT